MDSSEHSLERYSPLPRRQAGGESHGLMAPRTLDIPAGVHAGEEETQQDGGVSVWAAMARRKLLVFLCALTGLLAGLAGLIVIQPQYRSTTTIEIQGFNEAFMGLNLVDPQAGSGSYAVTQSNILTQSQILASSTIINKALEKLERDTPPVASLPSDSFAFIRNRIGLTPREPIELMKLSVETAVKSLDVKSVGATRIIEVTSESISPEIAAAFLNSLAGEYIAQNLQVRASNSQATTQWLSGQVEETKAKLEQAEARLQEYVKKSGLLFVQDQDTLATTKLKQAQNDLASIQSERIAKQARAEMAAKAGPESVGDVLDDMGIKSMQTRITELRREMAQLTTTLTPNHYKVKRIESQINEVQVALDRDRQALIGKTKAEYEAALRREKLVQQAYAQQSQLISAQSDKAVQYGLLKREVETLRTTLNVMLTQSNQAGVASAVPATNARIIDQARPGTLPSKPVYPVFLGAGFALGLLIGGIVARLLESRKARQQNRRFQEPGRISTLLQAPELGVIPSADFNPVRRSPWQNLRNVKLPGVKRPEVETGNAARERIELTTWRQKPSLMAESFRLAMASLRMDNAMGRKPRLIVMTSPGPGEGKTTVSSNLAIAMADSGLRVLLVDADFRKPRLHDIFSVSNEYGASDLLREGADLTAAAAAAAILPTEVPGLSVMPSGPADRAHAHRGFYSSNVMTLLTLLRKQFDMVVIDTPPMLQFPEARLLGKLADGVVLVVRSRQTERDSALECRLKLAEDRTPLLGTMLNDWDPSSYKEQHYASGYHYRYYAQEQEKEKV